MLMSDIYPQNPKLFTLKNASGMEATIMDWGATLISVKLKLNGELKDMLIGPAKGEDYHRQYCYMGATIGRYANRIDRCEFEANGKSYVVDAAGAKVALHGGREGFDKRRFEVIESTTNSLVLKTHSPDGDMGFPGNFDLVVKYHLQDDGGLRIDYEATCDQECPACITNHSYFNLNGKHSSILDHSAKFNSEEILVIDEKSIPTGEVYNVTRRSDGKLDNFNFTEFKGLAAKDIAFIDDENMRYTNGYDHAFIVRDYGNATVPCATVRGNTEGEKAQLEVYTDYPAFQFYTGNFINVNTPDVAIARDDGEVYKIHEGFCIEPEYFPDAPHLKDFAKVNPMVSPSAPLKKFIIYKFTVI